MFERFITFILILNTILYCVRWAGEDKTTKSVLDIVDLVFTSIFGIEIIVKIIGYGWRYFKFGKNVFDLLITIF